MTTKQKYLLAYLFTTIQIVVFLSAMFFSYLSVNHSYYNEKYLSTLNTILERSDTLEFLFNVQKLKFEDLNTTIKNELQWAYIDIEEPYNFFLITPELQILLRTEENSVFNLNKQTFDLLRKNLNTFIPIRNENITTMKILKPIFLRDSIIYIYVTIPLTENFTIFEYIWSAGIIYFIIIFIIVVPVEFYLLFRFISVLNETQQDTDKIISMLTEYIQRTANATQERLNRL